MTAYLRPLTVQERAEMRANGWTCARCGDRATKRIVGPGAFRLCDRHSEIWLAHGNMAEAR